MPAILFVCTANRIRSPMTEYLLKAYITRAEINLDADWRIESAGTWTEEGRTALAQTQTAAAKYGLDLADHRSRPVEAVQLDEFDLILTMECGQRDALRAEHAAVPQRIYTLTEAVSGVAYDIDDPIGKESAAYEQTFLQLARLIEQGGSRLLELTAAFADLRANTDMDADEK